MLRGRDEEGNDQFFKGVGSLPVVQTGRALLKSHCEVGYSLKPSHIFVYLISTFGGS